MLTVTRKAHSVVQGLSRFAQVTVGRPKPQETQTTPPRPEVLLNGHASGTLTDRDRTVIESAEQGVRQAELDLGWRGSRHYVLKVEGLLVDGIDADAARLAAEEATKALINT